MRRALADYYQINLFKTYFSIFIRNSSPTVIDLLYPLHFHPCNSARVRTAFTLRLVTRVLLTVLTNLLSAKYFYMFAVEVINYGFCSDIGTNF